MLSKMEWTESRLIFIFALLFLLLLACNGDDLCPRIWAVCPDREFQICRDCRLIKQMDTDIARFVHVRDCTTGWNRRVVIGKDCSVEYK